MTKAAGLRPNGTDVVNANKLAMRFLARRVRDIDAEVAEINAVLYPLVVATRLTTTRSIIIGIWVADARPRPAAQSLK